MRGARARAERKLLLAGAKRAGKNSLFPRDALCGGKKEKGKREQ